MKIRKLFQKTQFGIFGLFGLIVLSTSALTIYTVQTHLTREYEGNSRNIAKTIADASVDILLNRNLATLQSLIDQFVEIQGIRYVYITSDSGEFLAHTFVPGIPEVILESDPVPDRRGQTDASWHGRVRGSGQPDPRRLRRHRARGHGPGRHRPQDPTGHRPASVPHLHSAGGGNPVVHLVPQPGRQAVGAGSWPSPCDWPGRKTRTTIADEPVLARDDEAGELARLLLHIARRKDGSEEPPPVGGRTPASAGERATRTACASIEPPSRSSARCCRSASGRSTPGASSRPCWCTSPGGRTPRPPGPSASPSSRSAPPRPGPAPCWDGWGHGGWRSPAACCSPAAT